MDEEIDFDEAVEEDETLVVDDPAVAPVEEPEDESIVLDDSAFGEDPAIEAVVEEVEAAVEEVEAAVDEVGKLDHDLALITSH